jgi:hypothetical protein
MKKLLKKIFNIHEGFEIEKVIYSWEGKYYEGYILWSRYSFLGVRGYSRIEVFVDKEDAIYYKRKLEEGVRAL